MNLILKGVKIRMKNIFKVVLSILIVSSIVFTGSLVNAQTHFGFSSSSGIKIKAESWFSGAVKVTKHNHSGVKMKNGKYVKRTAVKIVEGKYNSGWVYSKKSPKKKAKVFYRAIKTKNNNPFHTSKTSYKFEYFK